MASSIEQDIIEDIKAALDAVDYTAADTNDYALNLYTTEDPGKAAELVNRFAILIEPDESNPDEEMGGGMVNIISWTIEVKVRSGDHTKDDKYGLSAFVRDTIMTDVRRSGLATKTAITNTSYFTESGKEQAFNHVVLISGHCRVKHALTNYQNQ